MPWLTPDEAPEGTVCRPLFIPDDPAWLAIVSGAILELTRSWNYEQFGTLTPDQCAELMQVMQQKYYDEICSGAGEYPTPYWDEDIDVDDEEPADSQPWYGHVPDPTLPADELTFVENAAIWGITGFLAYASWEVGFAPAILFHTIAPRFVLAWRRGDVAEIIRVIIDGVEQPGIDTTAYSEGDVIRQAYVAGDDIGGHDILIVQES